MWRAAVVVDRELLRSGRLIEARVKSATLQARKRFAADLAERDCASQDSQETQDLKIPQVGPALGAQCVEVVPTRQPDKARGKAGRTSYERLDADVLQAYTMRRWWLDRYSLDEIRELAGCLR